MENHNFQQQDLSSNYFWAMASSWQLASHDRVFIIFISQFSWSNSLFITIKSHIASKSHEITSKQPLNHLPSGGL